MATIEAAGRVYTLEIHDDGLGRRSIQAVGARGACYVAIPFSTERDRVFFMDEHGRSLPGSWGRSDLLRAIGEA